MSYIIRTYACDSAGTAEEHIFEVMLKSGEHPKFCPQCGFSVDQRAKPRPAKMSIGGAAITKSVDRTYRMLEKTSKDHPNPQMRITNMKDHLREGDVAAVLPNNSVTQFMQVAGQHNIGYGFGGGAMGSAAMLQTRSPTPVPQNTWTGPGHVGLSAIQGDQGRTHHMTKAQTQLAGQVNKGQR